MNEYLNNSFGEYIEKLRRSRGKSLRETAKGMGVSAQFYSEVEKGRRCAFIPERLNRFIEVLELNSEETRDLYDIAAKRRSDKDVIVPQDYAEFIVRNPFVMEALKLSKETGAGEKEWQILLDELRARKG